MSMDRDGDWKHKDDYNYKSVLHVPLWNHDAEFGNLIIEVLLEKLVKELEIQENYLKEIKTYVLGLIQKVESYVIAIKHFEQLFR